MLLPCLLLLGNVYICDYNNQRIRKVTISTGIITTYAGTGSTTFGGDNGPATSANLYAPRGAVVDATGILLTPLGAYRIAFSTLSFFIQVTCISRIVLITASAR